VSLLYEDDRRGDITLLISCSTVNPAAHASAGGMRARKLPSTTLRPLLADPSGALGVEADADADDDDVIRA